MGSSDAQTVLKDVSPDGNNLVGSDIGCGMALESIERDQLKREVIFQVMRSKGPADQHVNKTSSAVRATHLPSGLQVRVDSDRSQYRNKHLALERLQIQLVDNAEDNAKQYLRNREIYRLVS